LDCCYSGQLTADCISVRCIGGQVSVQLESKNQ
jgi:hypothetical protein